MKKIFLLILFFVVQSYSSIAEYYYYSSPNNCVYKEVYNQGHGKFQYGWEHNAGPSCPSKCSGYQSCYRCVTYNSKFGYYYLDDSIGVLSLSSDGNWHCHDISSCPSGQVYKNGKCVSSCPSGQFKDKNGTCVPFCASPFKYVVSNGKGYCKAPDFDKSTCEQKHYYWFNNIAFKSNPNFIPLPTGCYHSDITKQYINSFRQKLSSALSVSYLADLGFSDFFKFSTLKKIFGGGKTLFDFIKDKFSSNSANDFQDISNQDIKVQDIKMSDNGADPVIDLTPLEDLPQDASYTIPGDKTNYDGNPTFSDKFDFSSLSLPSNELDNLPADIPSYSDNVIGTKDILDSSKDITSYLDDATEVNTPVKSKISLSDDLINKTQTKQFDLDTIRISDNKTGSNPVTKYKQTIKYPDGSVTNLDIVKTDLGHSGSTYDITTTTPLSNGDTFTKTYHIQKSSDGSVINTFKDPATITKINSDGSTDIVPNSAPDTVIGSKPGISLVPITNKLEDIENKQDATNQQLEKIDNTLRDFIDYTPPQKYDFDQSLKDFQDGITNFDVNVSNYLNYLNNFETTFKNLKTSFDNSKHILENKPTFNQHSGSCGFNIHAMRRNYLVDPCKFVTPYRPLLVLFFTLLGNIAVFIFAVKFLISKGSDK